MVLFEVINLPQVSLSEDANISRLETPYGLIRRRGTITVPSEWALLKIKDPNFLFVFGEEDRKDVLATDKKTLAVLSRVLGEELAKPSDLCSLLLPKKATKPKTAKKKSSLAKSE